MSIEEFAIKKQKNNYILENSKNEINNIFGRLSANDKDEKEKNEIALLKEESLEMLVDLEKEIDYLFNMYNEIFFEEPVTKEEIEKNILREFFDLLSKVSNEINKDEVDLEEKIEIINNFVLEFEEEKKIKTAIIEDLNNLLKKLNSFCKKLNLELHMHFDMELALMVEYAEKDNEKVVDDRKVDYDYEFNKYSLSKIKGIIKSLKAKYEYSEEDKKNIRKEVEKKIAPTESDKKFYGNKLKETLDIHYNRKIAIKEEMRERLEPFVKEFEKMLVLRSDLEKQLYQIIHNSENSTENEIEDPVLKKYQEIINQAKLTKEEIKALLKNNQEIKDADIDNLIDVILKKAKNFLQNFSDRIIENENKDESQGLINFFRNFHNRSLKKEKIEDEDIMSELETYNSNLILTAGVWKSLEGRIRLEDIKGVNFEKRDINSFTEEGKIMDLVTRVYEQERNGFYSDISKEDFLKRLRKLGGKNLEENVLEKASQINQMLEIYKRNYKDRQDLKKEIVDGFLEVLQKASKDTNLYFLEKDNNLMGFIRYDKLEDGKTKYAGSFNIDVSLHQMSLGGALFLESLEEEAKDYEVVGVCDGFSSANIFYVEKGHYVVERIDISDLEKNKFPDFHIRRDNKKNCKLRGVSLSNLKKLGETEDFLVKRYSTEDNNWEELMKIVNNKGFVISRIVKEGNSIYCGFEKVDNFEEKESDFKLDIAA